MINNFNLLYFVGMYHFKTCAQPYCKDVTHDKSIGSIDISSMLVINEYIFVQVCLLALLSIRLTHFHTVMNQVFS